jgi:hypothetical protein
MQYQYQDETGRKRRDPVQKARACNARLAVVNACNAAMIPAVVAVRVTLQREEGR